MLLNQQHPDGATKPQPSIMLIRVVQHLFCCLRCKIMEHRCLYSLRGALHSTRARDCGVDPDALLC